MTVESSPRPRTDSYDVVVVGGGMAGLTAGALLACNETRVLVMDAHEKPGGFARTVEADGYTIDPGVHLIQGGSPDGPFGPGMVFSILERLGVSDRCELKRADPFYTAHFPGRSLVVPAGRDAVIDAFRSAFPDEGDGFESLVDLQAKLMREWLAFPIESRASDWLAMPLRYPTMFRQARTTMAKVMARHLKDPKSRAAFAALWPYVGLPPSQAAFAFWAVGMASYWEEGAYYCPGGFQRLADAVATSLVDHGGDLVLKRSVDRILVADEAVEGVVLDDGEKIGADVVVAAGDARKVFGRLIAPDDVSGRWKRRVRGGDLSMSILGLYVGTDLDVDSLGVSKENIIQRSWDLEANWRDAATGGVTGMSVFVPTLGDPTVAPPDRHQVAILIAGPTPFPDVDRSRVAEQMVTMAEAAIPQLGSHIAFAYGADKPPTKLGDLPLHELGPIYGWAASPKQNGPFRLPPRTPIRGLYLAGHWTQPGHGVWTVMISGLRAARLILGRDTTSGVQPLGL